MDFHLVQGNMFEYNSEGSMLIMIFDTNFKMTEHDMPPYWVSPYNYSRKIKKHTEFHTEGTAVLSCL